MSTALNVVFTALHYAIEVFSGVIILSSILSWFLSPFHPIRQFLNRLVDPLLSPFRRLLDRLMPSGGIQLDLSPLLAVLALQLLSLLLMRIRILLPI